MTVSKEALKICAHHFSSLPSVLMSGIFAIFLFKNATDIFSKAYKNQNYLNK